ncbi:homoserine O-acetyltransferase/O-succinyltransferase family protein [Krasilnikovia sp. MM14-A1004]|uniref:homoserine O-acetyltransferase/O-succinyltransferase family protein n=1 Tax=Krasilnikovia sp. MM14-A1004 TaxID=3373541 RepID=UPI00399CA55C
MTTALAHRDTGLLTAEPRRIPRIGIINLMPHAQQYEQWLLPQLSAAQAFEPVWIRLGERRFSLDDPAHIAAQYVRHADAVADAPLDALIVTGAAVEHLPYEEVRFLPELAPIVQHTAEAGTPVLGLCWGALAVAHLLYGLPKQTYPVKVSGIFETDRLVDDGPIAAVLDDRFWSTHSRYAGFDDDALDASGTVRAVARSAEAGTVIAESTDHGVVMHIGHPEYAGGRLADEYHRDLGAGLTDVRPPANVDLTHPVNLWRSHSLIFFASWVRLVHERMRAR